MPNQLAASKLEMPDSAKVGILGIKADLCGVVTAIAVSRLEKICGDSAITLPASTFTSPAMTAVNDAAPL